MSLVCLDCHAQNNDELGELKHRPGCSYIKGSDLVAPDPKATSGLLESAKGSSNEASLEAILGDLEQYGIKVGAKIVKHYDTERREEAKTSLHHYMLQEFLAPIGDNIPGEETINWEKNRLRDAARKRWA